MKYIFKTHAHTDTHTRPATWDKVQALQFGIQCLQNVRFLPSYQLLSPYSREGADTESITEPQIYCDFIFSEYIGLMRYIKINLAISFNK